MTVTVRFVGPIRRPWPETSRSLEVAPGSTVGAVLAGLGFARPQLGLLHAAVNGVATPASTVLADGDTLEVMLRVGGG
jgi:sulfur carrier protein ThiS